MTFAAADTRVRAHMGETLDALLWRVFARGPGAPEAVYAANTGLAALGPILPEDTVVIIPALAVEANDTREVKLWD